MSKSRRDMATRLTDSISLGVLADVLPKDLIDEVLNVTGKREKRVRLLPAHVVVRFCQAMCLFYEDDYEEVIRKLVGSLQDMRSWSDSWSVPSASALSQARQRLGPEPMRELFERVAVPVAGHGTKGAWLGAHRLMAIDGFTLDLPDTDDNLDTYGIPHTQPRSAYPQARVVGLGECGSHAIIDAAIGSCRTGEQTLMPELLRSVEPDMLILADRNFYSYNLWRQYSETGAALLWRVTTTLTLPVLKEFPDGSYLSTVVRTAIRPYHRAALLESVRNDEEVHPAQGIPVRVIEYMVPDRTGNGKNETIRLITSLLDPVEASAIELAGAYHERWEFEGIIDEIKTHQRGAARVLRSKSAELVEQEIWALLLTHYAVRTLMCRAADEADTDPERISFMRSLRVIRRQITSQADFSP